MKETIQKLWNEKVDITLGNHPAQNNTLGKRKFMIENPGTNPFINPQGWQIFLSCLEEKRLEFEHLGY
jgi:metallo-beta-lactamase class B